MNDRRRCQRPGQVASLRAGLHHGFTLVEIMIVILIMGVLLNIATPAFIHARDSGQSRACVANLHNLNQAKEQWALTKNISAAYTLPPLWTDLSPFIRANVTPTCPTTGASYAPNGSFTGWGTLSQLPLCPYGGPVGSPHTF